MNQVTLAIFVALALPGCASAPQPEQAVDTDRAPCTGERFDGDHRTYARCIKHVATPAPLCSRSNSACVSVDA